ncbi:hypothetical protein [Actinomadura sp. NPDC049753]
MPWDLPPPSAREAIEGLAVRHEAFCEAPDVGLTLTEIDEELDAIRVVSD